jgi:hypothetical protein
VYGREYAGRELRFEASGGLLNASLVMQDKETDSYWAIMEGESLAGEYAGTRLEELPQGVKAQWKDWVQDHPDTLVLSVEGVEHVRDSPYDNYFGSKGGFRGVKAKDQRLQTKDPVFAFQLGAAKYAVPFRAFEAGGVFNPGQESIFLFRPLGVEIFYSTLAFRSKAGFARREGAWQDLGSGARFDPESGAFTTAEGSGPARLEGFDTFWYTWSLTHPDTGVLGLPE